MAGTIDKGNISRILAATDWNGHPTQATVNPCTNSGAITPALTIPWYLRGKMGGLKVGDCVAYALFDDGTGVIIDRLDGEWTGVIDYPTTTTGDVVNEKTEKTIGKFTGTGGMAISGGDGATVDGNLTTTGDVVAGGISLQDHTHTCARTAKQAARIKGGENMKIKIILWLAGMVVYFLAYFALTTQHEWLGALALTAATIGGGIVGGLLTVFTAFISKLPH